MKVWAVMGSWDYEGSELVAVFSTEEAAKKYALFLEDGPRRYDWVTYEEFVLDGGPNETTN